LVSFESIKLGIKIFAIYAHRRRQKNFQRRATEKTRPKNSTIKSLSTLSVPCKKIQGGHALPPLPTPMIMNCTVCLKTIIKNVKNLRHLIKTIFNYIFSLKAVHSVRITISKPFGVFQLFAGPSWGIYAKIKHLYQNITLSRNPRQFHPCGILRKEFLNQIKIDTNIYSISIRNSY